MTDLQDYFAAFQNGLRAAAAADGSYTEDAFVEEASRRLSTAEEVDSLLPAHFEGAARQRKMQLDGYDFGDEEGQIVLAVVDYRSGDEVEVLTMTDARRRFSLIEAFLETSLSGALAGTIEESSVASQVAAEIFQRRTSTFKARLYLLTNAKVSGRLKSFETSNIGQVAVEYHVWDIERFERVESSQLGREEIDIDLTEWVEGGVPALESISPTTGLRTYLAVVPGLVLAGIYAKHGGRVLEANVRSFLTTRVNVNKGMRGTIQQQPEMFLAYNNGIAATASGLEVEHSAGITKIVSIRDLQIVNGGQTTASLFYTERNDKADLSEVAVQMKLIVVAEDAATELVPKISRYANTQNRISEADFFSNHPFHVRMEEKSRRLMAPAAGGTHYQTKWFYERTRGQFQNERARLSVAEIRRFENEYPRAQLITKTDAAKFLVSWARKPHTVSAGAQKNFIAFANEVSLAWERDDSQFGDAYFQKLVSLGIMFSSIRRMVQKASWYSTGYLANIVTYSLAKLADIVEKSGSASRFDFNKIWRLQSVPQELLLDLEPIAKAAFDVLTDDARPVLNVTEWAKREACWERLRSIDMSATPAIASFILDEEASRAVTDSSKKIQKLDSSIGAQIAVLNLGSRYWVNLREFGRAMKVLTEKDIGIISTATGEAGRLPSELQSAHLIQLSERMKKMGFEGK